MVTNGSATLYHKTGSGYTRTFIAAVCWQGAESAAMSVNGKKNAAETEIYIPFSVFSGEIAAGDYLVRGDCPFIYADGITGLIKEYHPLTIMTVERCDYGSAELQHWEVSGK